jgi:hypothetical protein
LSASVNTDTSGHGPPDRITGGTAKFNALKQVRFCRDRFSPTGDLGYRERKGAAVRLQAHSHRVG